MRLRLHVIAVSSFALAAACGGGGTTTNSPTSPTTPTTPVTPSTPASPVQTTSVSVSDNQFDPVNIQVAPGSTVTWTWVSNASLHNVTFSDGGSGDKIGSFSKSFPTAGTFSYTCTLHGGMNGTVLVK